MIIAKIDAHINRIIAVRPMHHRLEQCGALQKDFGILLTSSASASSSSLCFCNFLSEPKVINFYSISNLKTRIILDFGNLRTYLICV